MKSTEQTISIKLTNLISDPCLQNFKKTSGKILAGTLILWWFLIDTAIQVGTLNSFLESFY